MKIRKSAFDKYCEEKSRNSSAFWTNVLLGQCRSVVDAGEYGVQINTFRAQARKAGFRTAMYGEEVQLYR
ncbi:MAG: hypothetical protein WC900_04180 [Oscillospiraceae bacterium]|jgi:hypothetical protein